MKNGQMSVCLPTSIGFQPAGVNADFHVLYHEYPRPHDYERLITKFLADGRDLKKPMKRAAHP